MEDRISLEKEVTDWKENIPTVNKGSLVWDKELIFNGRTQRGYEVDFDAAMQWGCAPTETLLMSLAACLAIDVVHFLRKMRVDIKSFRIDFEGERRPAPPQYYKSMDMRIVLSGSGITPKKIERAISLSQEKYCSVHHSLRQDIRVSVSYAVDDGEGSGES